MDNIKHLYIHVPFTNSNCKICDKQALKQGKLKKFIDEILQKIDKSNISRNLSTLYIGGLNFGSIPLENQKQILESISKKFLRIEEFSVELYPQNCSLKLMALLAKHNVNRVVLKTKTFDENTLKKFNMHHNTKVVEKIINTLELHKINNVALDLNFGFNNKILKTDMAIVKTLKPNSVYWYSHDFTGSANDVDFIAKGMINMEYKRFELTGFAQSANEQSLHSKAYYSSENWLAIGKGGLSFINNKYGETLLDKEELYQHILIMALQHKNGLNLQNEKHFLTYNFYRNQINKFLKSKKLIFAKQNIFINPCNWVEIDKIISNLIQKKD